MTFPSKPSPNLDDHLLLLHRDLLGRIVLVVNDWDDDRLVAGLKAGEERAGRALCERYWPTFCRHVRRSMRVNREDSEEVAQDALLRITCSIHQFEGRSSFRTWAFKLLRNASIDFKKRPRNRVVQGTGTDPRDYDEIIARNADAAATRSTPPRSPESALLGQEDRDLFWRLFADLTREQQAVITYRQLDGLSTKETAEMLNMTPDAVKAALCRGMQRLAKSLRRTRARDELRMGGPR